MIVNGGSRRAGAGVLLCLGLVVASGCASSQPDRPPASAGPSASGSAAAVKTIDGTAFYLESKGAILEVHAVRGGTDKQVSVVADTGPCPFNTAVISPDGDHIAWAESNDPTGGGNLAVSSLAGLDRRTLPVGATCRGSTSLIWLSPTSIAVTDADDPSRQVLHSSTTGEPLGDQVQGAWSPDGAWVATTDSGGKPIVMPKGSAGAARRYTYTPPAAAAKRHGGWSARGVSTDGRYVAVGWNAKGSSRAPGSFAIVDTDTSEVVTLPVTGAVSSVHFLADGTVLVRVEGGGLVLLDQRFTVLGQTTEPASVHRLPLLRYVPS